MSSVNAASVVTSFSGSALSQLYPIVLAVAGAFVGFLVLRFGVNLVLRFLRTSGGGVSVGGEFWVSEDYDDLDAGDGLGSGVGGEGGDWSTGSGFF
jgi:hypothetical protein